MTREQANELLSSLTERQKEAIGRFPCGTLKCAKCPFNIEEKGGCFSAECIDSVVGGDDYDNH